MRLRARGPGAQPPPPEGCGGPCAVTGPAAGAPGDEHDAAPPPPSPPQPPPTVGDGPARSRWEEARAGRGGASLTATPAPHPIGTYLTVAKRTAAPPPNQVRRPLLPWQRRPGARGSPGGAGRCRHRRAPLSHPGPQVTTRGWGTR